MMAPTGNGWRRTRLSIAVSALAGAVGAAAVLISFIVRTDIAREPEHVPFAPATFFGISGALAGAAVAWPTVWSLGRHANWTNHILLWLALGFGYGVMVPLVTGALLPISAVLMDASMGGISPWQVPGGLVDGLFRVPVYVANHTALALITTIYGGLYLGLGAWAVDLINWSRPALVAEWGTWATAGLLGALAVVLAIHGSPDLLARLG